MTLTRPRSRHAERDVSIVEPRGCHPGPPPWARWEEESTSPGSFPRLIRLPNRPPRPTPPTKPAPKIGLTRPRVAYFPATEKTAYLI